MSIDKPGFQSFHQKKSEAQLHSWKDEIEQSIGRSTKELGIFDRKEVEGRIMKLFETIPKMKEFEFISDLKRIDPEVGVYVIGGSVRDAVLKKPAKDIDLVINRIKPETLVTELQRHGKVIFDRNPKAQLETMEPAEKTRLIQESYGVIKFNPKNSSLSEPVDVAFPREDDYSGSGQSGILGIKRDTESKADPNLNIVCDLERRDFTINAMAINLVNGEIVDPFDGIEDIVKRKIRTVGLPKERILNEDLSRGFRAIRFACVLSAEIEDGTKKAVKEIFKPAQKTTEEYYSHDPAILAQVRQYENEVRTQFGIPEGSLPRCLQVFWDREQQKPRMAVAKEVMSKEILKAIQANPRRFVEIMDELGGLKVIFPELARLKNLAQPREHHREGDAFRHTLLLFDNLPSKAGLRLKLAALFHDLGKADTQQIDERRKITFHGHAQKSAEHFQVISQRFRLPSKLTEEVLWLVQHHMFPLSSNISQVKSTTLEKMFLQNEDLGKDLIALSQADALSSLPQEGEPRLESINLLIEKIENLRQAHQNKSKEIPRIITGKDLIGLGLKPGPDFSRILDEIRNAQLDGRIKTKEEGIELVKKIHSKT
jgi:poly(A) polymerase